MRSSRYGLPLTHRELQILRLTCAGYYSKEIASQLGIALKTVEKHKDNTRRKLMPDCDRYNGQSMGMLAERQGLLTGVVARGSEAEQGAMDKGAQA